MQTKYTMSETLQESLNSFFQIEDLPVLKESLRRLFLEYLQHDLQSGLCDYILELFFPFNNLLDVLEEAAQEKREHFFNEQMRETAIKQPITTQEKVIAFVKASLNPQAIFLVHQSMNEDHQQLFDLLVVIPPSSKTKFTSYEQVITMANMEDVIINVSLHKAEVIEQQLQEGHIYYSMVCNSQNLLYTNGWTLPQANKQALSALAEKAKDQFNIAFKKADCFLQGASNYQGDNEKEMAAFMLQQAFEIMLRGLITALLGSCAKTHCFAELKKPLKRCVPEIEYLVSADAAEETRLLTLLEKAYLESRYSNQFTISNHDLDILSEAAEGLHEKVADVFAKKLTVLQ